MCSAKPVTATEIEGQQPYGVRAENAVYTISAAERKLDRSKTRVVTPEDVVVGRSTEKQKVIDLVGPPNDSHNFKVISVWGWVVLGKLHLSEASTEASSLVAGSVLGPLPCARSTGRHFFEIWPCSFK